MTVRALLRKLEELLGESVDNPQADATEIVASVIGCAPNSLRLNHQLDVTDEVADKAVHLAALRAEGEPIQYVIGSWSFMGREYKVGRGVLIPRDDTEVVVTEALKLMNTATCPTVIDLCSGSGIIAITLEKELKNPQVFAVEKSPSAFSYLEQNARLNSSAITTVKGDINAVFADFADSTFELIISNPPYIRTVELDALQKEVKAEPTMALDGGDSGYDFYDSIIKNWTPKLKNGGVIAFEIGEGQFDYIKSLLTDFGYSNINGHLDIQNTVRAVTATKG